MAEMTFELIGQMYRRQYIIGPEISVYTLAISIVFAYNRIFGNHLYGTQDFHPGIDGKGKFPYVFFYRFEGLCETKMKSTEKTEGKKEPFHIIYNL